jgi:hypothetical protein
MSSNYIRCYQAIILCQNERPEQVVVVDNRLFRARGGVALFPHACNFDQKLVFFIRDKYTSTAVCSP